jgi:DNA-binding protein HU-beta
LNFIDFAYPEAALFGTTGVLKNPHEHRGFVQMLPRGVSGLTHPVELVNNRRTLHLMDEEVPVRPPASTFVSTGSGRLWGKVILETQLVALPVCGAKGFFETARDAEATETQATIGCPRACQEGEHQMATGLTKTALTRQLAEKLELTNKQSAAFLDLLAETAIKETKKNGVFVIPGIGRLVKAERKARMGRNPQTGEAIKIKAKTVVKFRVAKSAKDTIAPPKK